MKDIAEEAGVSLTAIYSYFSSKEHLLAEALFDWATSGRSAQLPAQATIAERFATVVRRGMMAYRRAPQYAELYLESASFRDQHAVECMGRLTAELGGEMRLALDGLDPDIADLIRTTIGQAWLGGLFECVHGRTTFARLERTLVEASRVFADAFTPGPPIRTGRPSAS